MALDDKDRWTHRTKDQKIIVRKHHHHHQQQHIHAPKPSNHQTKLLCSYPDNLPDSIAISSSFSSLQYNAPKYFPVATPWAPVRVAMSMITPGFKCRMAALQPSLKTSLPSASVLLISTVFPLYMCRMSSARVACVATAFSAKHRTACNGRRNGFCDRTAAPNELKIAAAPPMSLFIPNIPGLFLI
mmetsp:Transcript_53209/g.129213  ORF Transcript_53209/g.129213 Transcript_53209/m.129213 type:complete len:186 (-) Transcript_53209:1768-2325(-)